MGRGAVAVIFALLGAVAAGAAYGAVAPDPSCAADRVIVQAGALRQEFTIELADTDAKRAQGLMNRPHMPSAAGMLFAYSTPQSVQFWMANTLIPLDMVFAGPDGTILHVHENAKPLDRSVIDGGAGVQYVLEINGGLAGRMGIGKGGALHHPLIAGSDCAPN